MKILIFDPTEALEEKFIPEDCKNIAQIDYVSNLPEAAGLLQSTFYDVLLMKNITADEGFAILSLFRVALVCHPTHVICITSSTVEYQALSPYFNNLLFTLLYGNLQDESINTQVMNKLHYLFAGEMQRKRGCLLENE